MVCPNCGMEIGNSTYCEYCGVTPGKVIDTRSGRVSKGNALLFSAILPGSGLVYLGDTRRGLTLFLVSLICMMAMLWTTWYVAATSVGLIFNDVLDFALLLGLVALWVYSLKCTAEFYARHHTDGTGSAAAS